MKKKFWTGRLKTILIVALIIAICAAVIYAAVSIEPSVPVAGPDDPINAERKR